METLHRSSSVYRPLSLNGMEIAKISFYKDGKVTLDVDRGWLEREKYPTDTIAIDIEDAKRANKINLERTDNFYIPLESNYSFDKGKKHLFIYDDNIVEFIEEKVKYDESYQIGYESIYTLNLPVVFDDGQKVKSFRFVQFSRWEDKPIRAEYERIKEKLEKMFNVRISTSDIEKFLKSFQEIK